MKAGATSGWRSWCQSSFWFCQRRPAVGSCPGPRRRSRRGTNVKRSWRERGSRATHPRTGGRPGVASLDDGTRRHDASVVTEDGSGPTRRNYRFNVAAYPLDKLLGLNLVPPSVERTVNGRPACRHLVA